MVVEKDETRTQATLEPGEPVIRMSRLVKASREAVFAAWTDVVALQQWWGPEGFVIVTQSADVRQGGHWRFIMRGPDGTDWDNRIHYREVTYPERIVMWVDSGVDDDPRAFKSTASFKVEGGYTRVIVTTEFPSVEARDAVLKFGAVELGRQTWDKMAAHVQAGLHSVTLVREFDAPRDMVFSMWTDPKHLAAWWGPRTFDAPVCEIEARPGGAIVIDMRGPDGGSHVMTGEVVEIDPPKKLVFYSRAFGDASGPGVENINTVTFEENGGRTVMTVIGTALRASPEIRPYLKDMEGGWAQSLDKMGEEIARIAG